MNSSIATRARHCRVFALAAAAAVLPGCATTLSQMAYLAGSSADNMADPRAPVYGGTRIHAGILGMAAAVPADANEPAGPPGRVTLLILFEVIDLPLSFVADTVLLPVTVIEWATLPPLPSPDLPSTDG